MKIFTHLRNRLFPVINRQNEQISSLQQELKEATQQFRKQYCEQAEKEKALLQELEYLYQIFIYRNHCRYQLHIFPKLPPVLLTVGRRKHQTSFGLYVPSLCMEVASVIVCPVDTTLVIQGTEINAWMLENSPISVLLAQEMIAEAKSMGMEQIGDATGQIVAVGLAATGRLCGMIGLAPPSGQEYSTEMDVNSVSK